MIARLVAPLLVALLAGAVAQAAPPASAAESQKLYDKGLQLYGSRQYEEAIATFKRAFDLDPRREILFAWAQAERLSGDCPSAVVLYRRFLATNPGAREVEAAQLNLKRCEGALSTRPDGSAAPVVPVDDRAREAEARAAAAEARAAAEAKSAAEARAAAAAVRSGPPFYRDKLGAALVGVGAGLLVVGAGIAGASAATESDARAAATYGEYSARLDDAAGLRSGGLAVIGLGGAVLVGGIIRWAVVARRSR